MEVNEEGIKAAADEVYAAMEAASRMMNEKELANFAIRIDEMAREIFGVKLWRDATYEGL